MRFLLPAAALLCSSLAAHADTFELFNLNANLTNGGTVTGTVNLDLNSTIAFDAFNSTANLVYKLGATSTPITGANDDFGSATASGNLQIEFPFDTNQEFLLALPTPAIDSLAGFAGGLCTGSCPIFNTELFTTAGLIPVISGTFTPATPEPTSLMLLGTGALGIFGAMRRRA